ncbi:MAG: PepSY domain-containing protein [Pseudomonadales bacterium]|nr:PepSY domain-containing protein [Pseudomonadales bacterium]
MVVLLLGGLYVGTANAEAVRDPFQSVASFSVSSTSALIAKSDKGKISLERAIKKAKAKYGGKVLSAKEIRSKGPLVYKIKILLPNGRVKSVFVDGETGEVFEA